MRILAAVYKVQFIFSIILLLTVASLTVSPHGAAADEISKQLHIESEASQNAVWWHSKDRPEVELFRTHWCHKPTQPDIQEAISRKIQNDCKSTREAGIEAPPMGYVACIQENQQEVPRTNSAVRRRSLNGGRNFKEQPLYAGMAICAGDTILTWRDIDTTVQMVAVDEKRLPDEAYRLYSYTQALLDPASSQLIRGRMDVQADAEWKARRITTGEGGPQMRTTGSKITLEVTDSCAGEVLVQVHEEEGDSGQHFAEMVRFNRRGKELKPERIKEGEAAEVSNTGIRWLPKKEAAERLSGTERSNLIVAWLDKYLSPAEYEAPPLSEISDLGTLSVKVRPKSAQVFVNNRSFELRRGKGQGDLSDGQYTVYAAKAGYKPEEYKMGINAGETQRLSITLEKLRPESAEKFLTDSEASVLATPNAKSELPVEVQPPRNSDLRCQQGYSYVGPGWFMMGSEDGDDDEKPVHRVDIENGFCMQTTEVTNEAYGQCVKAGGDGCTPINYDGCYGIDQIGRSRFKLLRELKKPNHPVVCVDWAQAKAYAEWVGGRLPSEAEWEYAARVGAPQEGESEDAYSARASSPRIYAWGNTLPGKGDPLRGNFADEGSRGFFSEETQLVPNYDDSYQMTSPVGSFPAGATPEGLFDMTGNVWEWTQDEWHNSYLEAPNDGRPWQSSPNSAGGRRVIRGGGWDTDPVSLRAAHRLWGWAGLRYSYVGFRVVLPPPGDSP